MPKDESFRRYVEAVGLLSGLVLLLFGLRILITGTLRYWFIPENLALAWVSLAAAWLLISSLKVGRWKSPRNIILSVLWLLLLPNTFYVITDFIHVYPTGEISQLYDICLVGGLVFCGFILGCTSLFLVHRELMKRISWPRALAVIELVILLTSFAIYLGRDLRWNSWDVLTDPGGLLLSVSDRVVNPLNHQRSYNITGLFFAFLSVVYLAFYRLASMITPTKRSS